MTVCARCYAHLLMEGAGVNRLKVRDCIFPSQPDALASVSGEGTLEAVWKLQVKATSGMV
ncbi:hypothetical protein CRENPOLYSF2_980017 [Crenothrix polyspora]|uniref:Uncharacterized protein n=1 Tax=Crenothrix polyspora TaxID=360316 RepID=A0A1R4HJC7_9GAMM|nr:hypothetical protein CRENPOLYSF2_980017 [Crenothrix polyspora]